MSTTGSEEGGLRERGAAQGRALIRVRLSPYTYAILAIVALELVCVVLSLLLPWGKRPSGGDVKAGVAGLMPWFLLVPVLIQLGFVVVHSGLLKAVYIVADFILGLLVVFFHYLSYLKYGAHLRSGFYLVFAGAGLAIVAGVVCAVEARRFPALLSEGKAAVHAISAVSGARGNQVKP